jgi:hypothetical protein
VKTDSGLRAFHNIGITNHRKILRSHDEGTDGPSLQVGTLSIDSHDQRSISSPRNASHGMCKLL